MTLFFPNLRSSFSLVDETRSLTACFAAECSRNPARSQRVRLDADDAGSARAAAAADDGGSAAALHNAASEGVQTIDAAIAAAAAAAAAATDGPENGSDWLSSSTANCAFPRSRRPNRISVF